MDQLRDGLLWLDAAPWRFWTVAGLTLLGTTLLAWLPGARPGAAGARGPWLFSLAVIATLGMFRWPTWFYLRDLNPDEAQIVAGALTLDQFPVYWKYVDGTTHGPLCEYLLLAAGWCRAPLNYATARILAALLQAGSLLAVWGALRLFTTERVARLAILPGLVFWSFVSWDDFLHYSTELPGIFLLSLGTYGIARVLADRITGRWPHLAIYLSGLCLGAVPYGKLQSVPQGAMTAVLACILLWRGPGDRPARLKLIGLFVLGGATASLGLAVFLTAFGLWGQFHAAYIQSALVYMEGSLPFTAMPGRFFNFAATSPAFAWFLAGSLGFALLYARGGENTAARRTGLLVAWLLVGAAYFSVLRPGREAVHYLHLLVAPVSLLAGFTLAQAAGTPAERTTGPRWTVFIAFLLLTIAPQIFDRLTSWHRFVGFAEQHRASPLSAPSRYILERAQPGDTLAMWGWEPHLLVEVGMPHGTREAHSASQLMQGSMTQFFVERYLFDLKRRRPAWFVDVVGPGAFIFDKRDSSAHETIPALRDWIGTHYTLAGEFGSTRVYHRKTAATD